MFEKLKLKFQNLKTNDTNSRTESNKESRKRPETESIFETKINSQNSSKTIFDENEIVLSRLERIEEIDFGERLEELEYGDFEEETKETIGTKEQSKNIESMTLAEKDEYLQILLDELETTSNVSRQNEIIEIITELDGTENPYNQVLENNEYKFFEQYYSEENEAILDIQSATQALITAFDAKLSMNIDTNVLTEILGNRNYKRKEIGEISNEYFLRTGIELSDEISTKLNGTYAEILQARVNEGIEEEERDFNANEYSDISTKELQDDISRIGYLLISNYQPNNNELFEIINKYVTAGKLDELVEAFGQSCYAILSRTDNLQMAIINNCKANGRELTIEQKKYLNEIFSTMGEKTPENIDAEGLADELYKATLGQPIFGWGTDEDKLIEILGNSSYSPAQIMEIAEAFNNKYGVDLLEIIKGETSGFLEKLLVGRLEQAEEFCKNNPNITNYNPDNIYNEQYGSTGTPSVIENEDGSKITTTPIYNSNGDIIGIEEITTDKNGNVVSKTNTQNIFDENGVLREQKIITTDADGKTQFEIVQQFDEQGRLIYETKKAIDALGNTETRNLQYVYSDDNDQKACTEIRETVSYIDENGELIYQTKATTGDLKGKTLEEIKQVLSTAERNYTELGEEALENIKTELFAKIELIETQKFAFYEEDADALRQEVLAAIASGDYSKIEEIFKKINEKYYPEGAQQSLGEFLNGRKEAEQYYATVSEAEIQESFTIRDGYDPTTMPPTNEGENLLYTLEEIRKQYELYKQGMVPFEQFISWANNFFNFGTSEKDFLAIMEKYELEAKNLVNLRDEDFIDAYKALTGRDFTAENREDQQLMTSVHTMLEESEEYDTVEELETLALALNIDISSCKDENGNYKFEEMQLLINTELLKCIGAGNSTPGKALDNYKDTVNKQCQAVIDVLKMTLTTVAGVLTGGSSVLLQVGAAALANILAEATEKALYGEFNEFTAEDIKDLVESGISGAFSGIIKGWSKGCDNLFVKDVLIKGLASGAGKEEIEYVFDNLHLLMNPDTVDEFFAGAIEAGFIGAANGTIEGLVYYLCDIFGTESAAKKFLKDNGEKAKEVAAQFKKNLGKICNDVAISTEKTLKSAIQRMLKGEDVDWDWILDKEFDEIYKQILGRVSKRK